MQPWYFQNGTNWPNRINTSDERISIKVTSVEDPLNDRITRQLMFIPLNYNEIGPPKIILLQNNVPFWRLDSLGKHK